MSVLADSRWIEYRCTVCFNSVKKFFLIDNGTYEKITVMCRGNGPIHHIPNQMCEVVNIQKGIHNA